MLLKPAWKRKRRQQRKGTVSFQCKRRFKLLKAERKHSSPTNSPSHCCHSLHSHFRLLHWCLFKQAKSSEAKRLGLYLGFSGDYGCKRVCAGLCALCVSKRERDGEKVGQGKRDGQPQLSASVNVLTAHLNISMCHKLFVSPNVCLFATVC